MFGYGFSLLLLFLFIFGDFTKLLVLEPLNFPLLIFKQLNSLIKFKYLIPDMFLLNWDKGFKNFSFPNWVELELIGFDIFEDGLLDLFGGADFVFFENDVLFVLGIMA